MYYLLRGGGRQTAAAAVAGLPCKARLGGRGAQGVAALSPGLLLLLLNRCDRSGYADRLAAAAPMEHPSRHGLRLAGAAAPAAGAWLQELEHNVAGALAIRGIHQRMAHLQAAALCDTGQGQ